MSTSPSGAVGYQPPSHHTSSTSSPSTGSYSSYASSGYASSANAYFKQKQQQQRQTPQSSSITPQQQHVIEQYINQKQQPSTNFGGRKPQRPYPPPQQQPIYYCEICRISCASAAVSDMEALYEVLSQCWLFSKWCALYRIITVFCLTSYTGGVLLMFSDVQDPSGGEVP